VSCDERQDVRSWRWINSQCDPAVVHALDRTQAHRQAVDQVNDSWFLVIALVVIYLVMCGLDWLFNKIDDTK
jgi:hypothetical protein